MTDDPVKKFPRPWRIRRNQHGHLSIEDHIGRCLAYVYVRNEPGLRDQYLQTEEGLAMARAIARLSLADSPDG